MTSPRPQAMPMADMASAWLVLSETSYRITLHVPTAPTQIKALRYNKTLHSSTIHHLHILKHHLFCQQCSINGLGGNPLILQNNSLDNCCITKYYESFKNKFEIWNSFIFSNCLIVVLIIPLSLSWVLYYLHNQQGYVWKYQISYTIHSNLWLWPRSLIDLVLCSLYSLNPLLLIDHFTIYFSDLLHFVQISAHAPINRIPSYFLKILEGASHQTYINPFASHNNPSLYYGLKVFLFRVGTWQSQQPCIGHRLLPRSAPQRGWG